MRLMPVALIVAFAAGNAVLLPFSPFWYLQTSLCVLFLVAAFVALSRDINLFYVLCAGEPAAVLAGTVSIFGALALELLLLALLTDAAGYLLNVREGILFILFCLVAAGVTAWVLTFRQVALPLVILAIAGVAAVALCWLAEYRYTARFRREIS